MGGGWWLRTTKGSLYGGVHPMKNIVLNDNYGWGGGRIHSRSFLGVSPEHSQVCDLGTPLTTWHNRLQKRQAIGSIVCHCFVYRQPADGTWNPVVRKFLSCVHCCLATAPPDCRNIGQGQEVATDSLAYQTKVRSKIKGYNRTS